MTVYVPLYTTPAEVRAYCALSKTRVPNDDELAAIIARAEQDVDRILGVLPKDPILGLKLFPALLSGAQSAALSRATCAAAEWRILQRERVIVGNEDGVTSTGPVSFEIGPLPRPPGPKVVEELAGFGLIAATRTVAP